MRLIDADALLDRIPNLYERREVSRWVDDALTVDAIEVVRCRDCLYWQKSSLFRGHTVCRYVLDCSVVRREDDFCSRGERKDGKAHD